MSEVTAKEKIEILLDKDEALNLSALLFCSQVRLEEISKMDAKIDKVKFLKLKQFSETLSEKLEAINVASSLDFLRGELRKAMNHKG